MTKPIIVVKVPCKLLYVIQVKEFLIECSTSWPYLISEFLVAYITIVASNWPRTFFTPKVFLFSIMITTATYLWNKPRKHVLSHMHPTELVKKYKTIVNKCSCIYIPFIVFMCKAPSGSMKYSHWLKEPLYTYKHVSY